MVIIVPYRNRPEHLEQFTKVMAAHDVYIIEQVDDKPFNRGKLINVGFLEVMPSSFVAHDVDMIPIKVDYSVNYGIVQLAKSDIQKVDYLGGVTKYYWHGFQAAGGYHNEFFHRAEDNEMMFHLKRMGIPVTNNFGTFVNLPHPRTGPEFIPELWQKAQIPRNINMLENCHYTLISKENKGLYTLIKVEL